jgi:hypothetical protein
MTPVQRAVLWHTVDYRTLPPDLALLFDRLTYREMVDTKFWLDRNGYMRFNRECGWELTTSGREALHEKNRVRVVTRRRA